MNLPKRDEFSLRSVLALPKASRMGLESSTRFSTDAFLARGTPAPPLSVLPPSALLLSGMAVLVLALATTGYLWTRTPEPVGGVAAQGADAHASDAQKIDAMIERLATRLKDNPNDAAGWGMLARSYGVLGRHAEAVEAYAKALALSKDDAGLMVDYADALAVKNNRTLEGEPMKLVERALKIEPRNIKGLALAGTYAFDHKDYKTAVKHWTQVVEFGGPDNLFAQQIQPGGGR